MDIAWKDIAQYGVPTLLLLLLILGSWVILNRAGSWIGREVVIPVRDRGLDQFTKFLERCSERFFKFLDRVEFQMESHGSKLESHGSKLDNMCQKMAEHHTVNEANWNTMHQAILEARAKARHEAVSEGKLYPPVKGE